MPDPLLSNNLKMAERYKSVFWIGKDRLPVLDETMVTLLNRMGHLAVTAELSVRFLSPLSVGQTVTVTADLIEARGRTFRVAATAILPDGTRIATSEARCVSLGSLGADEAQS